MDELKDRQSEKAPASAHGLGALSLLLSDLQTTRDPQAIAESALRACSDAFGAVSASLSTRAEEGGWRRIAHTGPLTPSLEPPLPLLPSVSSGGTVAGAPMCLPDGGEGILGVGWIDPPVWGDEQAELMAAVANACALALSRVRAADGVVGAAEPTARDLRESEDRFRMLADNISQLAWMADNTGYLFWYNRRWFEYTGTTFEQMKGWGWRAVHHPDHLERVAEKYRRHLASGEAWEDTFPLRGVDGEYRWFLSRALPIRDADGAIIRWFGTNTDITELRRKEAEVNALKDDLQARLNEFVTVLETIPVAVLISDDPDCRSIRPANATARSMFLVPSGANVSRSAPPDEQDVRFSVCRDGKPVDPDDLPMQVASRTGGSVAGDEFDLLFDDGRVAHLYGYACALLNPDGRVRGSLGAFVDVTEKKRAELELQALNQRLRHAMTETHHRVKNNLQVITALIDMKLIDRPASVPYVEVERLAQHVRALAAVHDLLTGASKAEGSAEYLGARQVLGTLTGLLAASLTDGRRLHVTLDDTRLTNRQASSLAIVLNELVSNAAKHGAGDIDVAFLVDQTTARLIVRDHGEGFSADFDLSRSANTGLELIANLAAWDLRGQASFQNLPDGGASVTVAFPVPGASSLLATVDPPAEGPSP